MTINDIAKLCGLSKSTVSRYLTGGSVSKKSAVKIARVIEQTGFEFNVNASRLRGGGSKLIGVLVDGIKSSSVARELTGINERLHEEGYQPFIMIDDHTQDNKIQGMQALVRQGVDGILFGAANLRDEHVRYMHELEVPVLVLGQKSDSFPYVKVDDYGGGHLMGEHVAATHPRSIVYMSLPLYDRAAGVERQMGFQSAFNGISARITYIEGDHGPQAAYNLGPQILAANPDFVVCASDSMCYGVLRYLAEQGLSVPEDVRLAGFGDYDTSSLPQVALTSLSFDYHALGRDAAGRIVALVKGDDIDWERESCPMELHVRQSSQTT